VVEDIERTLIAARGIQKHYGGIVALDDVSLEVVSGEIHALVGENGAGKSTLVKILTGAETPDSGEVTILGEEVGTLTPEKARDRGIGAVYQEPSLVPELTVLENVFLGRELRGRGRVLERKTMRKQAHEALERVGARIRIGREVAALSVAERQLVEIARALVFKAQVLIFDEPSAILSGPDLDRVFKVIEELRADGLGILYISHRLAEIFRLADRATVLKDGRVDPPDGRPRHRREALAKAAGRACRPRSTRARAPAGQRAGELRVAVRGGPRSGWSRRLRSVAARRRSRRRSSSQIGPGAEKRA
jgi:ABC-type sugar transport system ATPase subunit